MTTSANYGTRGARPYERSKLTTIDPATGDTNTSPYPVITIGATVQRTSQLKAGWVLTQDETGTLSAAKQTILADAAPVQAQHVQGFGAGAVWPTQAGAKDYSDFTRIFGSPGNASTGNMKNASTARVLYACGCPAWMKVPVSGSWDDPIPAGDPTNEYSYTPPHHSHYQDYADLVADIVNTYTQITHVVWWNEFKGFFRNDGSNKWGYGPITYNSVTDNPLFGYTPFYNKGYSAIKAVRPTVKVGGPYMVFNTQAWEFPNNWSTDTNANARYHLQGHAPAMWGYGDVRVLESYLYWIENATGADFVAYDLRNSTKDYIASSAETGAYTAAKWNSNPAGGAHPTFWLTDPWSCGQKIIDINNWLRGLAAVDATKYGTSNAINMATVPIWCMESYPNALVNDQINKPGTTTPYTDAVATNAEKVSVAAEWLRYAALAGSEGVLQWRPQGDANGHANPLGLWNSSAVATGLPAVYKSFVDHFSAGAQLLTPQNVPTGLSVLATATHALLINKTATSTTVVLDGTTQTVAGWEAKLVVRP